MKIIVSGKNLVITDAIKAQVEKKLKKYDKYFKTEVDAFVTISTQKSRHIVEITISLKNGAMLRAESATEDMYLSIDQAIDKISRQMRKHKTKLERRFRGNHSIRFDEIPNEVVQSKGEEEPTIVKVKKFDVKPMLPEEAVLQMEMLNHDFFVFLNGDTNEVNIVYKRKDGHYGQIEPTLS